MTNTSIAAFQTTQLSQAQIPAPQNLWDNKRVLLSATEFVVICYAVVENKYK